MTKPYAQRLERNIRKFVKKRGQTMEAVALDSGLSRGYFFDILMGRRTPGLASLGKIAGALDIDIVDLLRPE
jgi:transcriptional regulator with XRE-family HTH domain